MNRTGKSFSSSVSSGQASNKSFRVVVKSRLTHEIVDPELQQPSFNLHENRKSIQKQSFEDAKNTLKKYIKNMKASSRQNHYTESGIIQTLQRDSRLPTGRGQIISSRRNAGNMSSSSFYKNKTVDQGRFDSLSKQVSKNNLKTVGNTARILTEAGPLPTNPNTRLPSLKQAPQISDPTNKCEPNPQPKPQTSQRQRLTQLQAKMQILLLQKFKILSSQSFGVQSTKNKNSYKMLEREMDKILEQIRQVKQSEENMFNTIDEEQDTQKDYEINKNIEILQKKVKILERLIGEKLFEADNLRNQYLQKVKQHKRILSEVPFDKRSKSTKFYRQANKLNPAGFKAQKFKKQTVCTQDMTTNQASYKSPLKSYYISPKKNDFYNSSKLTQPLPRSTYNCQYLVYGTLPKQLITMKSTLKDTKIFGASNKLEHSTYQQDFLTKVQKQPINFKELDCYKDKFKNLQVNYGAQRNSLKVGNDTTSDTDAYLQQNKQNRQQFNPRASIKHSQNLEDSRIHAQFSRDLLKTQFQSSMLQQQELQKLHLFNQRIKSQIKHKNLFDQKYKFRKELIKQRIKRIEEEREERVC